MLFKAPWSASGDRHFYAQWTTAAKIEADQWSLFSLTGWNVMIPGPPESLDASPAPPHPLAILSWDWGLLMDDFATPSECWEQAALCRTRADAAADERLRAVWISMALIWTRLAAHKERLQHLNVQGA